MAKIVKIMDWDEINISKSVGRGGVNNRQDVLIIQALMHYALREIEYFKNDIFSIPTGIMDGNTQNLILKYQRYLRIKRGARISVDGRIDPSDGLYVRDKKLMWTMGQLNRDASELFILSGKKSLNYISDIRKMYPQVDSILSGTAVGTLDLGLE